MIVRKEMIGHDMFQEGEKIIRTIYKNIASGEKGGIRIEIEKEITDILSA